MSKTFILALFLPRHSVCKCAGRRYTDTHNAMTRSRCTPYFFLSPLVVSFLLCYGLSSFFCILLLLFQPPPPPIYCSIQLDMLQHRSAQSHMGQTVLNKCRRKFDKTNCLMSTIMCYIKVYNDRSRAL